jgi:hypothetical protein
LTIGSVAITTISPSINPYGRGAIGRFSVVIGNLPIAFLA